MDLVDTYKFSMESISILSHIEICKLNDFYTGNGYLNYEEVLQLYDTVIDVFTIAVETSLHNYKCLLKFKECRSDDIPIIFDTSYKGVE